MLNPPASTAQVLELQLCTTTLGYFKCPAPWGSSRKSPPIPSIPNLEATWNGVQGSQRGEQGGEQENPEEVMAIFWG
jgi:hypothetical protein